MAAPLPLDDEIRRYLDWKRLEWGARPLTVVVYRQVLDRFARTQEGVGLAEFAPPGGRQRIRDFLADHYGHLRPSTRARNLAVLRDFFRWCVLEERGLIADPTMGISSPRGRAAERRAHSQEEVRRLIEAQDSLRDRVALRLLAQLGLRKNELRLAQYRHFDLERGTMTVFGKGGTVAAVPLPWADLRGELGRLARESEPEHFLLYPRSCRERPMDHASVHNWFKRCLTRAGLPDFPMHELRHTAITEFLRQTGNLKLAQQLARHKSVATTADIYGHLELSDLADALGHMGGLLYRNRLAQI